MTLDEAIALARKYHETQVDNGGRPYVEHPLRVMDRVSTDEEKLTAVMHDLLEDTSLSIADLVAAGCPARVLEALDALTKRPGELYSAFVARAASNRIAHAVKLADIDDNLDPERLGRLDPEVAARLREKYVSARAGLIATVPAEPPGSMYEAGEPTSASGSPYARFDCAECGHPAGRVEFRQPSADLGIGSATGPGVVVTSLLGRTTALVEPEKADEVAAAVAAGDVAALYGFEFAPFWCNRCAKSYCSRHWVTEVVMDEGFYDCTYGTCPIEHRSMIGD